MVTTKTQTQLCIIVGDQWNPHRNASNAQSVYVSWRHHDDVIKGKHFLRYCPFLRRNHRSTVDSPHKGQWRRALMFSSICAWTNDWASNRDAGDLRRHRAHYDVTVMVITGPNCITSDYIQEVVSLHSIWYHFANNGKFRRRQGPLLLTWINCNPSMDK